MKKVLNVGGNSKEIPLPPQYSEWEHVLLDIDPGDNPDVVCDARELTKLPGASYDSVYCSHNLEHYFRHDARKVLAGFSHVLKPDGFVYIRVPDIVEVMRIAVKNDLDIDDVLYQSPAGPITVRDVIYGHAGEIEHSGQDFFAHKTGFSDKSLRKILRAAGFRRIFTVLGNLEVTALAFLEPPDEYTRALFNLPGPGEVGGTQA